MEDDLDTVYRLLDGLGIGDVSVEKLKAVFQMGQVVQRTRTKIVEHPDAMSFLNQASRDVRADEARSSSYQIRRHEQPFPKTVATLGTLRVRRMSRKTLALESTATPKRLLGCELVVPCATRTIGTM